jgi:hypothetical protein
LLKCACLLLTRCREFKEHSSAVNVQELKQLGSTKAAEMSVLLATYTKLVADAQKVQASKGKDKKLLCSDFSATLAQSQVAKAAALAGV